MPETAREFIDDWIENCVHASEVHGTIGAELVSTFDCPVCRDGVSPQILKSRLGAGSRKSLGVHWLPSLSGQ
jgi:hypothetical protein